MKKLITITHWLFSICIGIILIGAISGTRVAWIVGLILLILDIIIGIALQYLFNKKYQKYDVDDLTLNAIIKNACDNIERTKTVTVLPNQGFDEESAAKKVEHCIEMFNKSDDILNSEYNDYMFGIDLYGNKRPLSNKHNELVKKVLDSKIDIATASYLSIDDVITLPCQYLNKSIQNKIISIYGSLTPYSAFVFLNDYFYKNYNYILVIYKNQTVCFATLKNYKSFVF